MILRRSHQIRVSDSFITRLLRRIYYPCGVFFLERKNKTTNLRNLNPNPDRNQFSSAFAMIESRLGRGWYAARLFKWCEEGRIKVVKALLTHSPSTPPILTSELVIADRRIFNPFVVNEAVPWPCGFATFLCRLHLKDPGCVVGEHIHLLLVSEILWLLGGWFFETEIDLLVGDIDLLSRE